MRTEHCSELGTKGGKVTRGCKKMYNKELYKLCPSPFTEHKSFTFLVIYTEQTGFDNCTHRLQKQ